MCGIVGFSSNCVTDNDLKKLKQVMIESQIRGLHASGIAWFDGKSIQKYVKPIPMSELLKQFNLKIMLYSGKKIAMIAHTRYSTSGLKYNQPIVDSDFAIAHNGVITQLHPDKWKDKYGYTCNTNNDSELLLRAIQNGDDPIEIFCDSSIAAVVLNSSGEINYMRNHKRPIWIGKLGEGQIIASTYDILNRSGIINIQKIKSNDELQCRNMKNYEEYRAI